MSLHINVTDHIFLSIIVIHNHVYTITYTSWPINNEHLLSTVTLHIRYFYVHYLSTFKDNFVPIRLYSFTLLRAYINFN